MRSAAPTSAPPLVPLGELLARSRAEHADRLALADPERTLTYAELDERGAAACRRPATGSAPSPATA